MPADLYYIYTRRSYMVSSRANSSIQRRARLSIRVLLLIFRNPLTTRPESHIGRARVHHDLPIDEQINLIYAIIPTGIQKHLARPQRINSEIQHQPISIDAIYPLAL